MSGATGQWLPSRHKNPKRYLTSQHPGQSQTRAGMKQFIPALLVCEARLEAVKF
jgi:hypothetical protein